jgi:hypothetical protein
MPKSTAYKLGLLFCLFLVISFGLKIYYTKDFSTDQKPVFGVTFSKMYAEELGLDWQEAYLAVLDDLQVKKLRLVAYWSEVEPRPGQYDFSNIDWQLKEATKRGAEVVLVIGQRVPRWPECHFPSWVRGLSKSERQDYLIKLLKAEVNHFKDKKIITAWQVENEPLLTLFSSCPKSNLKFLKKEVMTVRELDTRPIIISDSGELSAWLRVSQATDILGITMYRAVWHKYFGYVKYKYFYPPSYYHYKAQFIKWFFGLKDVIITEYQAEPWGVHNKSLADIELSEQLKTINAENFNEYLGFVRQTGFDKIYLWGVEWWYWLKQQGHDSIWTQVRQIFQ